MSNPTVYPIPSALVRSGVLPVLGSVGLGPPLSRFKYFADFVNNVYRGGFQNYGNNNNDGRFFRDPSNVTATFCPNQAGLLISQAAAGLRRTDRGVFSYMSGTNSVLWNRDLTNAVWTNTNVTATKNQVGADGVANAATLLTATANGGTSKQSFTIASNTFVMSLDIKRVTGTGTIQISLDGGTTTKDITSGLSASYSQQFVAQAALTNPVVTIVFGTSGDAVAVDLVQMCVPTVAGLNIPTEQRYATTSATVINSQTRPNVASADAGPLFTPTNAPFAFYWQGRSQRPTGGFVITSDGNLFVNVGASGQVIFSENPAASTTANGTWRSGLNQVNKVAGWCSSTQIKVACNGNLGNLASGVVFSGTQTHWDLGTNGAGANTIMGTNESVGFGPNLTFSDADLIAMTT